jgi:hypothetical protein
MMQSRHIGGLVLLAILGVFLVALFFVPIADHVPQQAVHPIVDHLNFRSVVPAELRDRSSIKHTVRSEETFRILDEAWGVSETRMAGKWFLVENTATGERGYLASWYTAPAPTAIYDPYAVEYHHFGLDATRRIRSGITALAATVVGSVSIAKNWAWNHGVGTANVVSAIVALVLLMTNRRRTSPTVPPAAAMPPVVPIAVPPLSPNRSTKTLSRHYGRTASGKPFSAPRIR